MRRKAKGTGVKMIPFLDLKAQFLGLKPEIEREVSRVFSNGRFILGENVGLFEKEFAAYCGGKHCVGVGNGTDALYLSLASCGVASGSEVATVSHTAVATGTAIYGAGATPVFVDIDPLTFTMDAKKLERAITPKTKAILPVHLYGHPCDLSQIYEIAERHSLPVVEDCAQAHGSEFRGKKLPWRGGIGSYSFDPTKNLGAYGDAGAILTGDEKLAGKLRMLRDYGRRDRHRQGFHGLNSRLDELQAAFLRVKLRHLDEWNGMRRQHANLYGELLQGVATPKEMKWAKHNYHLYVIRSKKRDRLQAFLAKKGIGAEIHYPVPLHLQDSWKFLPKKRLPETEKACNEVLSLPIYPELSQSQIERVAQAVNGCP